ncbi:MAG: RnfABCDGE type electron transport complex subunit G [Desulfobacteraceae bacterium]|jgi:electron transport complex protein RnfG|nr:RnfABCDGE type electron transport complex subunit G [Desulfobacteraceae bacterium]
MREMIKMVVVLTVLSFFSGGVLAYLRNSTQERIDNQVLEFVKGPAVRAIFEGAGNDPIADRFTIRDGDVERTFFVAVFDGEPRGVAFETSGKGYGGDVGLMVGIDVKDNKLIGVGVTTHGETPGMGAKAKSDPSFVAQYKGLELEKPIAVTLDGGTISAISGATITSRAVSSAATDADKIYQTLKPQIADNLKKFNK